MSEQHAPLEVLSFVTNVLIAAGVREDIAKVTGQGLWEASMRGTDSHGIRLLPHYVKGVQGGRINPDPKMVFSTTAEACGVLDADHGFGHAAGIKAMDSAIELATKTVAGFSAVCNSSHCGAMSYFALRAAEKDMIGLAFTHATSKVRTPGSTETFFGTNPICFAAPMEGEAPFCFDSAPTFITSNRLAQHRESQSPVPPGCVADKNGEDTRDPNRAEMLLPIGDYKGFGWAMMVDILCGLLTGMPTGHDISKMFVDPMFQKRYLGQFFGAINIAAFTDVTIFRHRLTAMAQSVRNLHPRNTGTPMVPNDPEKQSFARRKLNGLPIKRADLDRFEALAEEFNIEPLKPMAEDGQ